MSKEFYKGLGKTATWPEFPANSPSPTSLTYDDVILIPRNSEIDSRAEVDLSVDFGPYHLQVPIISAPMDRVTGDRMVRELAKLGAIGCFPRAREDISEVLPYCEQFSDENIPCVYSLCLKNTLEDARQLKERGAQVVLIDIAHGGMEKAKRLAMEIKEKLGLYVMLGNIATYEQAEDFKNRGIDFARVGVGPGAVCTTRDMTGHGLPQLAAVFETTSAGIYVIADGGIKKPGDVAKALAADAKLVMIGSMLGATEEAPGKIRHGKKIIRGQASEAYMNDSGLSLSKNRTAEGVVAEVTIKGPVRDVIHEIEGGLRSGLSYSGARNIEEYQDRAIFSFLSLAAIHEGHAHVAGTVLTTEDPLD